MAKQSAIDDDGALAGFASHLRLMENRAERTVTTYLAHTRTFSRYLAEAHPGLSLTEVEPGQIHSFLLHEGERGITQVTRSTAYFALKSLYKFLEGNEEVACNPTDGVKIRHAPQIRTEVYTDAQAEQILNWARNQDGRRWEVGHTLLATLRFTGLRLNELVNLRLDQVNLDARRFSLVGKGSNPRLVPVPPTLAPVLRSYLEDVRPALPNSPYFFANPESDPALQFHGRFGPRAVHELVRHAGAGAGAPGRHFAHRWRHTYATSLLRHGEDIHVVQRLLGHSNIATTIRYLHLSDADLMDAVDRAFPAA